VISPTPLPISNFDNSKQQYVNLKGIWNFNRNWSVTGGYSYMMYKHNDVATDGYTYSLPVVTSTAGVIAPTNPKSTSLSYLNGYDAFTDGHANIVYLQMSYRFDAPPLPAAAMKVAEAPPAPVVRPAPPPPPPAPPPPPPPAPRIEKITLDSNVLFVFGKADLKPEGKAAIDSQVIGKLAQIQKLEVVIVTGHTDRIGSDAANQKLSEERAKTVGDYLASKGVDKAKIQTIGMGETQPVVKCDQKNQKELIACLQPNRRVDVEVRGEVRK